jgi:hypothetical protein
VRRSPVHGAAPPQVCRLRSRTRPRLARARRTRPIPSARRRSARPSAKTDRARIASMSVSSFPLGHEARRPGSDPDLRVTLLLRPTRRHERSAFVAGALASGRQPAVWRRPGVSVPLCPGDCARTRDARRRSCSGRLPALSAHPRRRRRETLAVRPTREWRRRARSQLFTPARAEVSRRQFGASRALLCGTRECSDYFVKTAGIRR